MLSFFFIWSLLGVVSLVLLGLRTDYETITNDASKYINGTNIFSMLAIVGIWFILPLVIPSTIFAISKKK